MNTALVPGLTTLSTALSAVLAATLLTPSISVAENGTCSPRTISKEAAFPMRSQLRGQQGTVELKVLIGADGRVRTAELQRSSGFRLLDHAATRSVLDHWVFDVSGCAAEDLPAQQVVTVEFRNDVY